MILFSVYRSKNYWVHYILQWKHIFKSIFSLLGLVAAILTILIFFLNADIQNQIKNYCYLGLIVAVLFGLWINRPKLSIVQQIPRRDVNIELCVADMFSLKGSYIIGTNTTFDTKIGDDLISETSVQGQFTKKFYSDYKVLQNALNEKLVEYPFNTVNFKKAGNLKSYEMGTVVKILNDGFDAYFVAMAVLNEHGVAKSSLDDIKNSLAKLWEFISTHGGTDPIIIPIFGSKYGRLTEKRDEILDEIVKSFINACSTNKFTDKLIIAIHPDDYVKWNLDLNELMIILEYHCKYPNF